MHQLDFVLQFGKNGMSHVQDMGDGRGGCKKNRGKKMQNSEKMEKIQNMEKIRWWVSFWAVLGK